MSTDKAFINSTMLQWALERAEADISILNANEQKAKEWLSGKSLPTFKQAQEIAKKLHIPFGYLYLKEPPQEKEIIPDLRTINNLKNPKLSFELKELIKIMKYKQEWYKDYVNQNDLIIKSLPRYKIDTDTNIIVKYIIDFFDLSDIIAKGKKRDDFLKESINKLENTGILIMRDSIFKGNTKRALNIDEFRGFAIYDDNMPLIFINTKDSKAGQIFTLFHELAHILLGESGISIDEINPNNEIELKCNDISANVLMPTEKFKYEFYKVKSNPNYIKDLSDIFSVSCFSVLLRLKNMKLIPYNEYESLYKRELDEFEEINKFKKKQSGGIKPEKMSVIKNGNKFSFAVARSVLEGNETYTNGADLLGYKNIDIVDKVAKEVGICI